MSTINKIVSGKWIAVTLILGVAAILTSPSGPLGVLWGLHEDGPSPVGMQKALFILLTAIQSLAFGLGVAFLFFGWKAVSSFLPTDRGLSLAMHLAISWSLLSWWLHSNLHQTHNPENLGALLAIEYGFHVTLIFSGLIIAYFFLMKSKQGQF